MNLPVSVRLASIALLTFGLSLLTVPVVANAQLESRTVDPAVVYSEADAQGRFVHLIRFAEPGLLDQFRQQRSAGDGRFNFQDPSTQSALAELQSIQQQRIQAMTTALGRELNVTHRYFVSQSGIATRLDLEEAARVRGLSGVVAVDRERVYQTDTFRGPEFIGAGSIWDGSATPPNGLNAEELRGAGLVAAMLDSAIDGGHPSYANDPACAHGTTYPDKLLSNLNCATTDGAGLCDGPPIAPDAHGMHTTSTVAGNALTTPDGLDISGVAPCAHVRAYAVCPDSCPGAQIQAGMDSVLIHGDASVMNFSISGGQSPWADNDRKKLDLVDNGVLVQASAGNTSASVPDPIGQVNHRGPWVNTIAASTHDGVLGKNVSLAGGPQNILGVEGSGPTLGADFVGDLRYAGDVDAGNFEGCAAFPAGAFTGEAALISRGTCAFADKVNNAVAAGATFVIVFNNAPGAPIVMGALEATAVSSVMISDVNGAAFVATLAGGVAEVTVEAASSVFTVQGDVLASFSLRGPTAAPLQNLQKPNITAPGVNILAAFPGDSFGFLSGTSMSSPHAAGAALLVRQVQPTWTPMEVKSAMQMTAFKGGTKDDGATPWDWDDVGHGRVDLTKATLAGLVMDEVFANFLAADPGIGGDVRTLNLPSVRDLACTPSCTFERTLRNTLTSAADWTATVASGDPDLLLEVTPANFSFTGGLGETVTLTITATPQADLTGGIVFGEIILSEDAAQAPDQHITSAISGTDLEPPIADIDTDGLQSEFLLSEDGTASTSFEIGNSGVSDLDFDIDEAAPASVVLAVTDEANPPQPISLVVDGHNGPTSAVGVGPAEFLWFNRLTPGPLDLPFDLEAVQIIEFPSPSFNTVAGDVYDVYVWSDPDGDPTSGDEVLLSSVLGETIGAAPAFVNIPLPAAVPVDASTGDLLIGLVNRTFRDPYFPALGDSGIESSERSWIAFAFPGGVVGNPPDLSQAGVLDTIDNLGLPRNWVIRGLGTGGSACLTPSDVPWLSVSPASGSVSSGDSQEIQIDIDMSGQGLGDFEARLCVETNDANNPVTVIPLSVTTAASGDLPTIDVDPDAMTFNVDVLNTGDSQNLDINNTGDVFDLDWSILEAEDAPLEAIIPPGQSRDPGLSPVLESGDGQVQVFADQIRGAALPSGGAPVPTLSVNGMESFGAVGDPANSTMVLDIGIGNQVIGMGWEVNLAAQGISWLDDARLLISPEAGNAAGGIFMRPGVGDTFAGTMDYSSGGELLFADFSLPAVNASPTGELFLEFNETFVDGENPDTIWNDSAAPVVLPPGVRLVCIDQAACDAAVNPAPPWLSVEGMETWGSSGAPNNSTMTLDIGVGNEVIGVGYDVTIETLGFSWLSESRLSVRSNEGDSTASGAVIQPSSTTGTGVESNQGEVAVSVFANAGGEIFLEWFESFDDGGPGTQDSVWSDGGIVRGIVPDGGIYLICTDQAACDQAVSGGPPPDFCDLPSDVSWLSVAPDAGTTAANSTTAVTVTVDASGLAPDTYQANLCISSNDPTTPLLSVPVTLNIDVPANAATIEGTVQSLGRCRANPFPAAGASVEVVGAIDTINTVADASGFYQVFMDDANSPVTVNVTAPDHFGDSQAGLAISGLSTTVADFDLVLDAPCAEVTPTSFSEQLLPGVVNGSYDLTVSNANGDALLEWAILEAGPDEVGYAQGLPGADPYVAGSGFDRSSGEPAAARDRGQTSWAGPGIQGAPINTDFTEGFDDITTLSGAGWSLQNQSDPLGTTDWFQGNAATFPAHQGDPAAYIGANFNNTAGGTGTISNWLITPEVELRNGTELSFWTRVPTNPAIWPDRLEVRLSTSGSSVNVGAGANDVGDFDTLLLSVNPDQDTTSYPGDWTEFSVTVSGLAGSTSGRFAFRYFVTDGGPAGLNSNYIGIDTVTVDQPDFCAAPADVPWLSVSPFFGSTPAGDAELLSVDVDASALDPGVYEAILCVNTNDAGAALIEVPFQLEVLDSVPVIEVDPTDLSFTVDLFNPTASQPMDISNVGFLDPLNWTIDEAQAAPSVLSPTAPVKGGPRPVLGTLDGSVVRFADQIAGLGQATVQGSQQLISVNGLTSNGDYDSGDPSNSSFTYNIGAGFQVTGVGWEVTVDAVSPSWLSESSMAIVTNSGDISGLFLAPGAGDDNAGIVDYNSGGIIMFADVSIPPILANEFGDIYLERFESFDDASVDPDSIWSDPGSGVVLPPGLTLVVEPTELCDVPSDVPWLSVDQVAGSTASGDTTTVIVSVDATGLPHGSYQASLCISSDDPATPLIEVPVTMEVEIPANAAIIEGTVESLGHCSANPAPAAGANVEVVGQVETINAITDASGFYQVILDVANSPVDVNATAADHIGDSVNALGLVAQTTEVVDFGLVLQAPCATVNPSAFDVIMDGVPEASYALTVSNPDSGAQLVWGILESNPGEEPTFETIDGEPLVCVNPESLPWMNVTPFFGALDVGESEPVSIEVNARELGDGQFSGALCLSTNDSELPVVVIPFDLQVINDMIFDDRYEQ